MAKMRLDAVRWPASAIDRATLDAITDAGIAEHKRGDGYMGEQGRTALEPAARSLLAIVQASPETALGALRAVAYADDAA